MKRKKYFYAKIRYNGCWQDRRKIWYINNRYICDCINTPFDSLEECKEYVNSLLSDYSFKRKIEFYDADISYHFCYKW